MPCLHIGIVDFEIFENDKEFYSRYRLTNMKNKRRYTDKFGINVLNLRHIDNANIDDKKNELDVWARLFKATTWEELKAMADTYDFVKEAATSIYAVSEDEAVKLACEARERYERDWASAHWSGEQEGIKKERVNTEREKKRADKAEEERDKANVKISEAEAKIDDMARQLQEALTEIARLKGTVD